MLLAKSFKEKYIDRLHNARLRILCKQGFYGTLLMHVDFDIDEKIDNMTSSQKMIYFNPDFMDSLNNKELDLCLIHEVIHLSLRHHIVRKNYLDKDVFDEAADLIVNSNILKSNLMDKDSIKLHGNILRHQTYDGIEGYRFSIDTLYKKLYNEKIKRPYLYGEKYSNFDEHKTWEETEYDDLDVKYWFKVNIDACEMLYIKNSSTGRGTLPEYAARAYKKYKEAKTDWKTILNEFIQEMINDYSFTPPDRRFSDSPFFLPDYNACEESIKDVLFMIDTSGSMSDGEITRAYSEVKGAVEQFGGKLQGWLGFFDAGIIEPKPFCYEEDLEVIHPYGGGGTSFTIIFRYIKDQMKDKNISSLVILTDGYAPWPKESESFNIPTIWLINNDEQTPPWGKVARIIDDSDETYN